MTSTKRSRAPFNEGDAYVESQQQDRPSLKQISRKRVRLSDAQAKTTASGSKVPQRPRERPNESSDSNSDGDENPPDLIEVQITDDYEHRRDADFEELAFEDQDTQRATQLVQQINQRHMDNKPAENGIIESVTCINFMCHVKLHVQLGPLINFIIGHNGSGKSAVLTALTLCLGGKAASTNRGQSLKSFIKEGQDSATLIVKIKNTGSSAYQYETYGDSIIVERHFTKAGASNFKLKSGTGRNISTKKADLEEVSDYFGMQIDNPMNVLTQDMARQFLNNSTPAEKYRFFVKGVQLEQLDQDYQLLEETINQIGSKLETRRQDIKIMQDRSRRAQAKHERSKMQNTLRHRIKGYRRQMAWVQVEQQEQILEDIGKEVAILLDGIGEAENQAITVSQRFDHASEVAEQSRGVVQEVKESLVPIQEERLVAKRHFDQNRGELLSVQTQQRSIRDHLKAAEARIAKARADIAEEHRRLEAANGEDHTRRLAAIEEAKEAITEAKACFDEHHERLPAIEEDLRQIKRRTEAAKLPIDVKRVEIRQCEDMLASLRRDRGAQTGAFHPGMPSLLRAIAAERGFGEKPIGPVGNHIQLLKPVWSSVLEKAFGGVLNSFIVTSKNDQQLLSALMRKGNCVCPILIGNNQPIDTSQHEPEERFDTTLRIDNDLVRRQLIINQGIEQTILIENRQRAASEMYDGTKLRNVKQCFCLNEQRRGWGIRFAYGRGNGQSSSPMQPMQGRPRMKTDTEAQISYQSENLRLLKTDLEQLEQAERELRSSLRAGEQALTRHRRQQNDLLVQVQRAEEHAEQLQDELERDNAEDGRLDVLKESLLEAEEERKINEGSYENAVMQKDQLNALSKTMQDTLRRHDGEVAEQEAKIKKAEARVLKMSSARMVALQEKNSHFQNITDRIEDKVRIERKQAEQAETVRSWSEEARKISQRVPVDEGETAESLDKKLEKLTADQEKFQREIGGTREEIAEAAADASNALTIAEDQVKDLDDLSHILKLALADRQHRWKQFRRFISSRARAQFTYLLSERSFRGALKTDHRKHILDLHVEPDETRSGRGRQTKTLSGGEKSFSTICLLLSLWEAMGSPIRCLDEFDVFMDNVNRDVSLKMMIGAARRSVGKQYILITPQSMGNVDVAGDVKIIKLSDPERGQTVLPFGG